MSNNAIKSTFSDPAYKKLSFINGKINDMKKNELVEQLELLKMNTSGVKDVLKKRLKAYHERRIMQTPKGQKTNKGDSLYDYFVVIDYEATCEENNPSYPHEIIEFPAILVDTSSQEIVDEFHHYVRPYLNRKLTDFCTKLTGITQDVVDSSQTFPEVLRKFEEWLASHKLDFKKKMFAIVTDGPWDMSRFMYLQCHVSKIPLPKWSHKWVNIRKSYCNAYGKNRVSLQSMLEGLSMEFEGRAHSGISDSRNISKILIQMIKDGCNLWINEGMFSTKITEIKKAIANSNSKGYVVITKAQSLAGETEEQNGSENDEENTKISENENDTNKNVSKVTLKEERLRQLEDDLKSCEDLIYYMSLKKS